MNSNSRLIDYFVVSGLCTDSGLEPDQLSGKVVSCQVCGLVTVTIADQLILINNLSIHLFNMGFKYYTAMFVEKVFSRRNLLACLSITIRQPKPKSLDF